jgi:hypothetical protein
MGEGDLKIVALCIIMLTLYSSFVILFAGGELQQDTPTIENKGLLAGIIPDINMDFINPFSVGFNSEIALINIFIFIPLILILGFVGIRLIRGV